MTNVKCYDILMSSKPVMIKFILIKVVKNMKVLNKFALVISKGLELLHWLGVALISFLLVTSIVAKDQLLGFLSKGAVEFGPTLTTYGFEVTAASTSGEINMTILTLFCVAALIIFVLMAMVFRNVYLILKKIENDSPFQKDIIRMLKEIGIFSIAVPVVGIIMTFIIGIATGAGVGFFVEATVNLDSVAMGVLVLCLTQIFTYGASLEKDVDGLL